MLTLERQEQIMSILREKKTVTVRELSETLFASGSTIRRDLAELENAGLIRRSHGGAVLFEALWHKTPGFLSKRRIFSSSYTMSSFGVPTLR